MKPFERPCSHRVRQKNRREFIQDDEAGRQNSTSSTVSRTVRASYTQIQCLLDGIVSLSFDRLILFCSSRYPKEGEPGRAAVAWFSFCITDRTDPSYEASARADSCQSSYHIIAIPSASGTSNSEALMKSPTASRIPAPGTIMPARTSNPAPS